MELNTDTNLIEKKFRESRKITDITSKPVRLGMVERMRYILQNWWKTVPVLSKEAGMSTQALYIVKSQIGRYLRNEERGDRKDLPKVYHALVDEYKDFITTEPENLEEWRKTHKKTQSITQTVKPEANRKDNSKIELPAIDLTNESKTIIKLPEVQTQIENPEYFSKFVNVLKLSGVKRLEIEF